MTKTLLKNKNEMPRARECTHTTAETYIIPNIAREWYIIPAISVSRHEFNDDKIDFTRWTIISIKWLYRVVSFNFYKKK